MFDFNGTPAVPIRNWILSSLPEDELDQIRPHLNVSLLNAGMMLAEVEDSLSRCYFPNFGMISLLSTTENGRSVEIGLAGSEGVLGLPVILGKNEMPYQALVQVTAECYSLSAGHAKDLFGRLPEFHRLILRYSLVEMRQLSQTCVCNHFHSIRARLCRWLSVMSERSGERRLKLTQEFLANILGVQRTSITAAAIELQDLGIVQYKRGLIEIADEERLRQFACECLAVIRGELDEFMSENNNFTKSTTRQTPRPNPAIMND